MLDSAVELLLKTLGKRLRVTRLKRHINLSDTQNKLNVHKLKQLSGCQTQAVQSLVAACQGSRLRCGPEGGSRLLSDVYSQKLCPAALFDKFCVRSWSLLVMAVDL
jgi:hypothetical protein